MQLNPAALARIAQDMRRELTRQPDGTNVQRLLEPYAVVLARKDGSLALHIGRRSGWVDLDEVAPFAEAFAVPLEDREPAGKPVYIDSRVAGHVRINTLVFTWREELLPQPAGPAAAGTRVQVRQLTIFGPADAYSQGA